MNGISDVRLRLHSQELEADHARAATPVISVVGVVLVLVATRARLC